MNRTEHLLTVLSEECVEVAKDISKAMRFGLHDQVSLNPDVLGSEGPSNAMRIATELAELLAMKDWLVEEGIIPVPPITAYRAKRKRVERYMDYALRSGALQMEGLEATQPREASQEPPAESEEWLTFGNLRIQRWKLEEFAAQELLRGDVAFGPGREATTSEQGRSGSSNAAIVDHGSVGDEANPTKGHE